MPTPFDIAALEARIAAQNAISDKYAVQVEQLRQQVGAEVEGWEALLCHLLGCALVESGADPDLDEATLGAVIEFGFQALGNGALLAMDGLAQERIAI